MAKYNVGDKVLIRATRGECWNPEGKMDKYCNTVMTIRCNNKWGSDGLYGMEEDKEENDGGGWCWCDDDIVEKVEDKKVFTAKDLKTGMFGVMTDGKKFVVVNDTLVYEDDGYDHISTFDNNNLDGICYAIDRVWSGLNSFRMLNCCIEGKVTYGTLVYERKHLYKRKHLYNGKVVCIDNTCNKYTYTVGKIYQFKDGSLTGDDGELYPDNDSIHAFEDWKEWSSADWIEVVE